MWHFEILKKESRALENTFFTSQSLFLYCKGKKDECPWGEKETKCWKNEQGTK